MKYRFHPGGVLTPSRHPGGGQCQGVSLTGAVSSQTVTEEFEDRLSTVGNRASSARVEAGGRAGEGPKGLAVRQLKRYASWVQNVVRQFGPYPLWAQVV